MSKTRVTTRRVSRSRLARAVARAAQIVIVATHGVRQRHDGSLYQTVTDNAGRHIDLPYKETLIDERQRRSLLAADIRYIRYGT